MIGTECLFTLPTELEVWLLLGYAVAVLTGARVTLALAQMHFTRARRLAETGFRYDADSDHYQCSQGQVLPLHVINAYERVAVYRAPSASCSICPHKAGCTPHNEGRHVYRPLAEWAETDVGRFHQWLAVLMAASVTVLGMAAFVRWAGQPGTGLLMVVLVTAAVALVRDWRLARAAIDGRHCAEE